MTTFTIGDQITLKDGREMTVTDLKCNDRDQIAKVQTRYKKDSGKNQTNWHNADSLRERVAAVLQVMETQYQPCPECGAVDVFRLAVLPDGMVSNARCLECGHTVIGGKFTPPAEPPPLKGSDQSGIEQPPLKGSPPDLFSLPKQGDGDLSDVITPQPAPPPRRKMTPDEERNTVHYLTATTSMNHNHARSLVEYFGHEVGNALTAGEGLDAAPGIGHVSGPTAASAWNRAPSWVRECLPLGIEGYPPSYIEYVMVHDLATDPDDFRDKYPLPDDEQPFAHLAKLAGVSVQQLATDIYALATFIEARGNKGYSLARLEQLMAEHDEELETYMLHGVYEDAYRGILFHATGEWGNYTGWGIRKSPHWRGVWLDRFKHINPERYQQELDDLHAQALQDIAVPPREHGDSLIKLNTRLLAYHAACADVLIHRYANFADIRLNLDDHFKLHVYQKRRQLITDELVYRAQHIPSDGDDHYDPRLSLADAMDDYEQAAQYLRTNWTTNYDYATYAGREKFFTDEYVQQVVCAESEPDLHIDLDDPTSYPRLPLSKKPPRHMTNAELSLTIMQLLVSKTEDEFTEDDKQNLLRYVRDQFPEAKNLSDSEAWDNLRRRLDKLNLMRS